MPAVSTIAARGADGVVRVALTNVDPNKPTRVSAALPGVTAQAVTGQVLTAPTMTALNTFEAPNAVAPTAFNGASLSGGTLSVTLPPMSVVMLELK